MLSTCVKLFSQDDVKQSPPYQVWIYDRPQLNERKKNQWSLDNQEDYLKYLNYLKKYLKQRRNAVHKDNLNGKKQKTKTRWVNAVLTRMTF